MKFNKFFTIKNKFFISTIITLFILFILIFLIRFEFIFGSTSNKINLLIQNSLYKEQIKPRDKDISSNAIVVVEIDNRTISDKEKGGLGRWQEFRREYYAKVIDNLSTDGAIVIGIDILFSEKSYLYKDDDKILADSIKKAGNVILAIHKNDNIYPIKELRDSAAGLGDILPIVNNENQNIYSVLPFYQTDNIENFSIKTLDKYYETISGEKNKITTDKINPDYFNFYNIKIPYSKSVNALGNKEMLINYLSNPKDFQKLSFVDVYNHKYDPNTVKDKIIFIGSNVTALHDEYNTPLGIIPGVYTHVNAANTILTKAFLHYFDSYRELIMLMIFTYLIVIIGVKFDKKWVFFVSIFLGVLIYSIFYLLSYKILNTFYSYPFQYFISLILAFSFTTMYKYIYEDKGKRLLQSTLSQYLAEDLVLSVLKNFEKVKLGGQRKENTIFFSDIAGFTSISEKMEPEELVHFLSEYLKCASDDIINNKGFINKYEGDAIMVLWGAFGTEKEQSYLACKGALEQQKTIQRLNISFKEKLGFEISVRMGINRGDVIIGNIGSLGRKIEFTALGDNVNLASRLEGINKYYNTLICVSESVKTSAGDSFIFRYIDKIKVSGKKNAVNIYELVGYKNETTKERLELIKDFEIAINLYSEQKFIDAEKIFEELVELGDKPSVIFLNRCRDFKINSPGKNWDSSWEFSEK